MSYAIDKAIQHHGGAHRARLEVGGADIWLASVEDESTVEASLCLLDAGERARAERFRFERDRTRFANRRAYLRSVLAHYLHVDPRDLHFRTSGNGRPELDGSCEVSFNASHSSGLAAVAVARESSVGIDIERRRSLPDALPLAELVCSPSEIESLRSLSTNARSGAFLRLWTRKEALLKANGTGLSAPLGSLDVLGSDEAQAGRVHVWSGDRYFTIVDLDIAEGHVGAVAISGASLHPLANMIETA